MVNRTVDGESNIFGISLNWRRAGDPESRGDGGPGGGDGKSEADEKAEDREEKKHRKTMVDHGKELVDHAKKTVRSGLGINVGVASLLKQSQLFTGTLGTIFQILGAMVDGVLAAFMPLTIPALKTMANSIPQIQEKMERVRIGVEKAVEKLREWSEWLKGNKWIQMLKSGLGELLQYWLIGAFIAKITGLWTPFWVLHKYFGFGMLKGLGLIAKQVGFMRAGTFTSAGGGGGNMYYDLVDGQGRSPLGPRGQGWGRGAGAFGTRGIGMNRGTAFGGLGIAGGIGAGFAMGGTGGAAGAGGGALVGGVIGSAIPGIGTMLGATAGSIIGGMLVSYLQRDRAESKQEGRATEADLLKGNQRLGASMRTSPNSLALGGGSSGYGLVNE